MDDTSEESKINEIETINALKRTQDNVTLDKQSDLTRNTKKSGTRVFIGRRTGKTIKVNKSFNIADCFPPVEESDEENLSPKEIPKPVEKPAKRKQQAKKAAKRHFIGRRTGKSISVNQPSNIQDFMNNIDNLFPQTNDDSIMKSVSKNDQSINHSQIEGEKEDTSKQEAENDNNVTPTEDEKKPDHSPNLTGTAVKNTAELDETAVKFYGSKKRLFPSCEESFVSQAPDGSKHESNVKTEEDVDVTEDIDIDVENCTNTSINPSISLRSTKSNMKKSKESNGKSKHEQSVKSNSKKSKRSDFEVEEESEDEEIDVENCSDVAVNKSKNKTTEIPEPDDDDDDDDDDDIENEESTFVTLGKKTRSTSRISEVDVTGISFEIDESIVMEGTKHKEMSPEFGGLSHHSTTKATSKETKRRKTTERNHSKTEKILKDGSTVKKVDNTFIDSTKDQSSHDVSKSRRSTRCSAKKNSQIEQDSEENDTKGEPTRKSTRGKKGDLTAEHIDSHQAAPKTKVSRKSILKRATSNTSTMVSSESDHQSSNQNEDSSARSLTQTSNRKSIRFSQAIDTDTSKASDQDVEHLTEDLGQSLNTSKKSRQSVRGKTSNVETLDEIHDENTLDISMKALTSTRNNIELPDKTTLDCSTMSTRSTRSSSRGKHNNTTIGSTRERRSMKASQSSLASERETVDHEQSTKDGNNLTTQSSTSMTAGAKNNDDDDDDNGSCDHVDDDRSSDDDEGVDNDDSQDDLNNDECVEADDVVDDGGIDDDVVDDGGIDDDVVDDGGIDDDVVNDGGIDDDVVDDGGIDDDVVDDGGIDDDVVDDGGIDDDVDDEVLDDDDEMSQTKRQTRSIVNKTHRNNATNSSKTSSNKEKRAQRKSKNLVSQESSQVSNTEEVNENPKENSTDDEKKNSGNEDKNAGRKSMHKNSSSDEDKSDNKSDQTTRKSRGRPRKSTRSLVETSQCDEVLGSIDMNDCTDQTHTDHNRGSQADNTKDSQIDNGQNNQTDISKVSQNDHTNDTLDCHDSQVSMSNDYEADESKTMSDSKKSASESKDDKKSKKKRRKKTSVIPKQLKNANRKRGGRKLPKDNTSRSGVESNASSDESSKAEKVNKRGKRKTQNQGTIQDNSQLGQTSDVNEDIPVATDEDYQSVHDTIKSDTIPSDKALSTGEDDESKATYDDENITHQDSRKRRGQENKDTETTVNKKSRSRNKSNINQTAMHSTSEDDNQSDSAMVTRKTRQQDKNNTRSINNNTRSRKRRNNSSESSTGSDNDSQSEKEKPRKTRKKNKQDKNETTINEKSQTRSRSILDDNPPETNTPMMTKSPFLHPKGSTIIKSILKSSLPRTGNSDSKNRRVSIAAKRNEVKSPELNSARKNDRRSSVSFAATPSFRVSPDDFTTPEDTPLGYPTMSFVSDSSSYTLGESTFTPGSSISLSSTISSVGSASRLSPVSSTFNESQEVTITSAKRQQVEEVQEDVIRRSKRTKVPPVQYWKNERIKYERRKSGWYIDGIESVPTPKVPKRKARKARKKKERVAAQGLYDGYGGDEPQTFNGVPTDFDETLCEPVPVINPFDGQEVKLELLHTPEMLQFVNTSQDPAGPDDPLVIDKFISHTSFGIGQLVLRPGAEKGKQHVRRDTMAFHVLTGQVEVTIHQTTALLRAGSTFYVPEGNCYNLKNTNDTDTRLFFIQIKSQD